MRDYAIGLEPKPMIVGNVKIGNKGAKKESAKGNEYRQPQRLNHFLITKTDKGDDDNFIIDEELTEALKKNPASRVNKDGELIEIPIRLMYDGIPNNLITGYARYSGSKLVCSGDGEFANYRTLNKTDYPCVCEHYTNPPDPNEKCKLNGTLFFLIEGAETLGRCHAFRTTGKNGLQAILYSINLIKELIKPASIAFLPLTLSVGPKRTVDGTGATRVIQMVTVGFQGQPKELRCVALEYAMEESNFLLAMEKITQPPLQIVHHELIPEEDEQDVAAEFYPDQAGAASKPEKEKEVVREAEEVQRPKTVAEKPKKEPGGKPEPEKKEARPKPAKKSDTTKKPEPVVEEAVEVIPEKPEIKENPEIEITPITNDQKLIIKGLANDIGCTKDYWLTLLHKHCGEKINSIQEINNLEADTFIAALKEVDADDVPF